MALHKSQQGRNKLQQNLSIKLKIIKNGLNETNILWPQLPLNTRLSKNLKNKDYFRYYFRKCLTKNMVVIEKICT